MLTELLQRKGLLTEMSAASKTLVHWYLRAGQQIELCETLSAEAMQAANQPIHQPLALKAFLTRIQNVFLEGREGRNVMVSLT